jgi:hypothetical protein
MPLTWLGIWAYATVLVECTSPWEACEPDEEAAATAQQQQQITTITIGLAAISCTIKQEEHTRSQQEVWRQ